jgi:sigma-B regulation protein RsbU (phosphoserine phosphatase)
MGMVPQSFPAASAAFPWDIHASIEPALEVGGDLYDVFRAADGSLCFFIGDVSGKGMPAALVMARTKSIMRIVTELTSSAGEPPDPAAIISRVNRELCESNDDVMFVTLFFGILSAATGILTYCNAGHNPPYRIRDGKVEPIEDAAGIVLGVEPKAAYQSASLALTPDDRLFLYTDGVTEAFNVVDEPFSEARLEAVLTGHADSCADMVGAVAAAVEAFVANAPRSDDIAMLALRIASAPTRS